MSAKDCKLGAERGSRGERGLRGERGFVGVLTFPHQHQWILVDVQTTVLALIGLANTVDIMFNSTFGHYVYPTTRDRWSLKKVEMFELYLVSIKAHTTQYSLAQTKELRTLGLESERREHDLRCSSSRTITRIIRFQQNLLCLFSYA